MKPEQTTPVIPDFRFLTTGNGEQIICKCNKNKEFAGSRFTAFSTPTALTLECDACGTKIVVIANKLAEE